MSFATAFLGQSGSATVEQRIATHLEVLLQSISPERSVGPKLPHASTIKDQEHCYMPETAIEGSAVRAECVRWL